MKSMRTVALHKAWAAFLLVCGALSAAFFLFVTWLMLAVGLPPILQVGFDGFFGTVWAPDMGAYGILPLLLAGLYSTVAASLLGGLLGFLLALFLVKLAPPALRVFSGSMVRFLAAVPSVIYGLVGMMVVGPTIRRMFHLSSGQNLLGLVLVLAMLYLPRITRDFTAVLQEPPAQMERAAIALGASEEEAWLLVGLRPLCGSLFEAFINNMARISGEGVLIIMVAGNVANMPRLGAAAATLSSLIASGGNSAGLGQDILFGMALTLLVLSLLGSAGYFIVKGRRK